ncbi:hypothetical protein WN943_006347 [Citrus x changshan-huyou]
MALLERSYFWPKMEDDVRLYVKACLVAKPVVLLQPLSNPKRLWQSISMDFTSGMAKSKGQKSILVVVDRFSKYAIFMPAPHACPADKAAELFFKHVVKYFGVPKDIISDRDVHRKVLDSTLQFDGDGIEVFYCQSSSDGRINGEATGMSPAELVMGQQPLTLHEVAKQHTGGKCPAAYRFVRDKQEMIEIAIDSLIWKKINSKMVHRGLVPKYDGPFEVMKQMDLAETGRQQAKHAPPIIRKQYDKEVERILDHKTMGQSKKNRRTEFLVQWKGGAAKRMLAGKRKYLCGNSSGRLKRTWTPCR